MAGWVDVTTNPTPNPSVATTETMRRAVRPLLSLFIIPPVRIALGVAVSERRSPG